ncbi:MAG: PEP-CTERM sorting domain-containing protein [Akkermansiaceae bacterium]|nr:PEP-CTERM sorting domain-containing protein [Akkermansiaceae bacterium]
MQSLLTLLSCVLVLACSPALCARGQQDTAVDGPHPVLTPASEVAPRQSVPEPNGLLALAFAGVVILARHRFRPN